MNGLKTGSSTILLVLGDTFIFFASLWAALFLRQLTIPEATFYVEHIYPFTLLYIMWIVIFFIAGLYDEELLTIRQSIADTVITTQGIAAGFSILFLYTVPFFGLTPKTNLAIFLVLFSFLIWQWRRFFFHSLRPPMRNVLLLGNDLALEEILSDKNFFGYRLESHISWSDLENLPQDPSDTVLFINYHDPEFAVHSEIIQKLVFQGYEVVDTEAVKERLFGKVNLAHVSYQWFITRVTEPNRMYGFFKRLIDILAGLILFAAFAVTLPLVYLAVWIEERRFDIFFVHQRIGVYGKPFSMFKLRSMSVKDTDTWDGSNYQHITRVGAVLRALRIDELPQSINLLRGDISLVGPRPIPPAEHQDRNSTQEFYHLRLFVKPGITGWAQTKQKYAPTTEQEALERLSFDLYYVKNKSFTLDIMIILKTAKTIVMRAGLRK